MPELRCIAACCGLRHGSDGGRVRWRHAPVGPSQRERGRTRLSARGGACSGSDPWPRQPAAARLSGGSGGLRRDRGGAVPGGFGARSARFLTDPLRMSRIASCGSGRFQDSPALPDIQTRVRVRSRFPSDSRTVGATIRACREPSRMMRVGAEWTIVPVEDSRGVSFFRTGRRRRPACAAQRACPRPCSFMRLRIPWLTRAPAYVPDRTRPSAPGGPRSSRLRLRAGGARPMCRNARGSVRDRAAVRQRGERVDRALRERGQGRFAVPGGRPEPAPGLRKDAINPEKHSGRIATGAIASRILYIGRRPDRPLRHQLLASIHFASNSRLL